MYLPMRKVLIRFMRSGGWFTPHTGTQTLASPDTVGLYPTCLGSWLLPRCELHRQGGRVSAGKGYCILPGWCPIETLHPRRVMSVLWRRDSAQNPGSIPSPLSQEPHNPVSLYRTLVHAILLHQSWGWVAAKDIWQTESCQFSPPDVMWAPLPSSVLWAAEPTWGWGPSLLRGKLCSWAIPPDSQLRHVGAGPALFMSPPFLPALMWLLL